MVRGRARASVGARVVLRVRVRARIQLHMREHQVGAAAIVGDL